MSFVHSGSTFAEVEAELQDCADFDVGGGLEKARRFVVAARLWLIREPKRLAGEGRSQELNADWVREMLRRAEDFVAANGATLGNGGPGVVYPDFGCFRG